MKPFGIIDSKNTKHTLRRIVVAMGVWLALMTGGIHTADASCLDLADFPLDSMQQAAPGMIMFVMDDSGSMDWSIMCPPAQEYDGVFNGSYYVFPNPGDNQYSSGNLQESGNNMRWMSQWSGYNGLYYDPTTEYTPWPTLPDADVDNPKSNPMLSSTLNMNAVWKTLDDVGVVVDNNDTGFSESIVGAGSWVTWNTSQAWNGSSRENYGQTSGSTATVSARWEASAGTGQPLDPSIYYNVQVWWPEWSQYLAEPQYKVYDDADLLTTSDPQFQNINGSQWMTITTDGPFRFFFGYRCRQNG